MTSPQTQPLLTVIIPHLNEPSALFRCLTSLTRQTEDGIPFEIIVADNGSSTSPVLGNCAQTVAGLVVETTPGPGPARNAGAALARSGLLAFIDADCVAEPGWIKAVVEHFATHPATDFVGGSIGVLPSDERFTAVEAYEAIFSYRTSLLVERQHFAPTGNMAVRRACFDLVGPFAGIARHEDRVWGHKAVGLGMRLDYLPAARVLTGGSPSFAALARRCDIHLAHDIADLPSGTGPRLRWLLLAGVVALSPLGQAAEILRSAHVRSVPERLAALRCLVAIRLYRARRMVQLMFDDWNTGKLETWNRVDP